MTAETEIDFLSLWPIKPKKHLLQIQQYLHDHSYLRALLRISSQIFYLQKHKLYKETNETKVKAVFIKKKKILWILLQISEPGNFEMILQMLNILSCMQLKVKKPPNPPLM